jgi:RimK family alpha-L-glutamate ligase
MIGVFGSETNEATVGLVEAWRSLGLHVRLVTAPMIGSVSAGDTVLGRLDILPTLDGVEPGLLELLLAERRGVTVLNPAKSLLAVHDKLRTAAVLDAVGLPHPPSLLVRAPSVPPFAGPYIVKPRYGSWGKDVVRCADETTLLRHLEALQTRPWFHRHGALVQQEVPNDGRDLRVVVAAGRVVGAGERVAGPGEWRTNVSCGGKLRPVDLDDGVADLARAAAAVVDGDFVGVDVMPARDGTLVVLELNGAVEFSDDCAIGGRSVALAAADALGLLREPTGSPVGDGRRVRSSTDDAAAGGWHPRPARTR